MGSGLYDFFGRGRAFIRMQNQNLLWPKFYPNFLPKSSKYPGFFIFLSCPTSSLPFPFGGGRSGKWNAVGCRTFDSSPLSSEVTFPDGRTGTELPTLLLESQIVGGEDVPL